MVKTRGRISYLKFQFADQCPTPTSKTGTETPKIADKPRPFTVPIAEEEVEIGDLAKLKLNENSGNK